MAGRGRGRARGLSHKNKKQPPFKSDLTRRHYTRSEYTLPDLVGSNDGQLLGDVSKFDGVDGVVKTDLIPTENSVMQFMYKHIYTSSPSVWLAGSTDGINRFFVFVSNEVLRFGYGDITITTSKTFIIGESCLITLISNGDNADLYCGDTIVGTATKTTTGDFISVYISAYNSNGSPYGFSNSEIWDFKLDAISIPLPHLSTGFDANNNPIELEVSGGVTPAYAVGGSLHLQNYGGVEKADGTIIPNGYNGEALYDIVDGDTFFAGSTSRLNLLPSKLRLFELGDTEAYKVCMDKSNTTYWKVAIQGLVSYDSDNTGDWLISEINSTFFYEYASDTFKYQIWAKNKNNFLKDFFIYSAPLTGGNICKAKTYVDEYETYSTIEDATVVCDNDIIE